MSEEQSTSVSAETALGKFSISGAQINTIFTIFGFVLTCLIVWVLFHHQEDARDAAKEFTLAVKELSAAQRESSVIGREQNCLMRFEAKDRAERAEFCKQVSR